MINKIKFWKEWKNKTDLEKSAIKSLKAGKKIILDNLPKEEIVSIYIKGSFPRREMNGKSDVDIVVILKTIKYLQKINKLEKKYKQEYQPEIQFIVYSLWELKTGKKLKNKGKNKASTSRVVKHLNNYYLIYGKALEEEKLFYRSDEKDLDLMIKVFKEKFLMDYQEKRFGFSEIIKQVFWLVENEEKTKGNNPPHNWKKLAESIEDNDNIIHDALELRLNPTKDKKIRRNFIIKLKKYLKVLEKN